ncbi:MAG TPA: DUF3386 family protein [Gemmataceae bacterium]|nr:DUF3386 family protein [Gemmataceae bacterium]
MKRWRWAALALALGAPAWAADGDAKPAADPAATKLLADARAARAVWKDFPGFTADVEINIDGRLERRSLGVDSKGNIIMPDHSPGAWALRTLGSVIGHRLDNGEGDSETPCTFEGDDADNPLGRAVRVLSDEFHSSYRIRDRQVIVVNRDMKDARFTITVMENEVNKEGKFLPVCFVVNTWDAKTNALTSSETHHQTWKRVDGFDLPESILVVSATADGKQEARSLKLSNIQLSKSK